MAITDTWCAEFEVQGLDNVRPRGAWNISRPGEALISRLADRTAIRAGAAAASARSTGGEFAYARAGVRGVRRLSVG